MSLGITESENNGVPVLTLSGRIKGEGDEKLRRKLEAFYTAQSGKIIVDVTETAFIDSHGLGILIYYHKILQNANRSLVLVNGNSDPQSYMGRLIEITNLDKVIPYVRSLEQA